MIALEITEDLEGALAQLKFVRCPHSLTASLAALPSVSLSPFAPFAKIASELKKVVLARPARIRRVLKSLFDHLEAGDSIEQFLEGFPSVKREQVIAVIAVIEANDLKK